MGKRLNQSNLTERPGTRTLLAISLSLSMAAFGCTTDRNLGNGDPVTTPGVRTSPTGSSSPGSESAPTNPPMYSSSSYEQSALPPVSRRNIRLSPDQAAALMAQHQVQPRVRVLGPSGAGMATAGSNGVVAQRGYASDGATNVDTNPALLTNPQLTLNSSISSNPNVAITSGTGLDSGAVTTDGFALGATLGASTAGGATFVPGTLQSRTFSPTLASANNPPASISGATTFAGNTSVLASQRLGGSAILGTTNTATTTTTGAATVTPTNASLGTTTSAGTGSLRGRAATATPTTTGNSLSNPVRIVNGANGRTTITNQR